MRPLRWIVERATGRRSERNSYRLDASLCDLDWRGLDMSESFNDIMHIDRQRARMQTLPYEELFLKLYSNLPKEMIFQRDC